jgi:hypothetical protein
MKIMNRLEEFCIDMFWAIKLDMEFKFYPLMVMIVNILSFAFVIYALFNYTLITLSVIINSIVIFSICENYKKIQEWKKELTEFKNGDLK